MHHELLLPSGFFLHNPFHGYYSHAQYLVD